MRAFFHSSTRREWAHTHTHIYYTSGIKQIPPQSGFTPRPQNNINNSILMESSAGTGSGRCFICGPSRWFELTSMDTIVGPTLRHVGGFISTGPVRCASDREKISTPGTPHPVYPPSRLGCCCCYKSRATYSSRVPASQKTIGENYYAPGRVNCPKRNAQVAR